MYRIFFPNRGPPILRAIAEAKKMGIRTVIGYTDIDKDSLPVKIADERILLGKEVNSSSCPYANYELKIKKAKITGSDAIYEGPGYGAENPIYAQMCEEAGFEWIGVSPKTMEKLSDKQEVLKTLSQFNIPIIPGATREINDVKDVEEALNQLGPIRIKPKRGGSGIGQTTVTKKGELKKNYASSKGLARKHFGFDGIYVEQDLNYSRDIKKISQLEIQMFDDRSFGDRDCSGQIHVLGQVFPSKKLIEEAPSYKLPDDLRNSLCEKFSNVSHSLGINRLHTYESLLVEKVDGSLMCVALEINLRPQVEIRVTELVTGTNLIRLQIESAFNKVNLPSNIEITGHAVEFRVYPYQQKGLDFWPYSGKITEFNMPTMNNVYVDNVWFTEYQVPPQYDGLGMLVTSWSHNRQDSIKQLSDFLERVTVEGVETTISFGRDALEESLKGDTHIGYLKHVMGQRLFKMSHRGMIDG